MEENLKLEKMRYQNNSFSYTFGFLGLGLSLLAGFLALNSITPGPYTIFKILYNIAILLVAFLSMEKAKAYNKKFCIALIVLGAVCLLRLAYAPVLLIRYGSIQNAISEGTYTGDVTLTQCYEYLDKICRLNPVTSSTGEVTYTWVSSGWLPHSPIFRGVADIVLLALAAGSFISAGVVGYLKSTKLEKYLNSIGATRK